MEHFNHVGNSTKFFEAQWSKLSKSNHKSRHLNLELPFHIPYQLASKLLPLQNVLHTGRWRPSYWVLLAQQLILLGSVLHIVAHSVFLVPAKLKSCSFYWKLESMEIFMHDCIQRAESPIILWISKSWWQLQKLLLLMVHMPSGCMYQILRDSECPSTLGKVCLQGCAEVSSTQPQDGRGTEPPWDRLLLLPTWQMNQQDTCQDI